MNKPSFVAIGPPKTGTTWLYEMLRKHPQVELTPVKEIGYFWEKAYLGDAGLINLINPYARFKQSRRVVIKKEWMARRLKAHFQALAGLKLNWAELKWDFRYFVLPHNDKWYLSLFNNKKVSGDISPSYALLPEKEIESLKNLNPDVKIIISLRDPVERQWSRVKMKIKTRSRKKKQNLIQDNAKLIEQIIEDKHNNSSFDYVEIIERWSKYFPQKNIFVFFYEELLNDPSRLLNDLCIFLGIDVVDIGKAAEERVNKGIELDLPPKCLNLLINMNLPYLEKMPSFFSKKYPKEWLEKYKNMLANNSNVPLSNGNTINNDISGTIEIFKS